KLRAHVREYGEDSAVIVVALRKVELCEDRGHVLLDGAFSDHESLADSLVRAALRDECEHFAFARCQGVEWIVGATPLGQEPRDDLWVERRASVGEAA